MNPSRLLQALVEGEVRFVVVGGLAAVAQGAPVVTFDVAIVHERTTEDVRRMLCVLASIDAAYVRAPGSPPIAPRAELLPRTVESRIGNAPVRLLSLEPILEVKRTSARPKDRAIVPLL